MEKGKKNNKKLVIIVSVIIVMVLCVVGFYYHIVSRNYMEYDNLYARPEPAKDSDLYYETYSFDEILEYFNIAQLPEQIGDFVLQEEENFSVLMEKGKGVYDDVCSFYYSNDNDEFKVILYTKDYITNNWRYYTIRIEEKFDKPTLLDGLVRYGYIEDGFYASYNTEHFRCGIAYYDVEYNKTNENKFKDFATEFATKLVLIEWLILFTIN